MDTVDQLLAVCGRMEPLLEAPLPADALLPTYAQEQLIAASAGTITDIASQLADVQRLQHYSTHSEALSDLPKSESALRPIKVGHLQQEVLLLPRQEVRTHSTSPWCSAPQ